MFRCWGTLVASVIVHPKTIQSVGAEAFDEFLAQLKYGCVTVNVSSTVPFALPMLPWGAYPGGNEVWV